MGTDFPISRAKLPRVTATPHEHAARKQQMQHLLVQAMDEYDYFRDVESSTIDQRRWKLVATRELTRLYRERHVGSGTAAARSVTTPHASVSNSDHSNNEEDVDDFEIAIHPDDSQSAGGGEFKRRLKSMRLVGDMPGRMENAVVSVVTKTREEMALVHVFLHGDVADSNLLCVMEGPTAANPLHFLGYKWLVKKSPCGRLIKHRDTVYLEYTGVTRNKRGEQIGFLLNESVDVPSFPEMPERNCVRSLNSVQFLMRQKSENVVEVFMTGVVEPSGNIPKILTTMLTPETLFAILKVVDLAEARRLTRMIVSHRQAREELLYSRRTRPTSCALCFQKSKFYNLTSLVDCNICGQVVCSRCRIYKKVFVSDGILGHMQRIDCCKTCVLAANRPFWSADSSAQLDRQGSNRNVVAPLAMSIRPRSASDSSVVDVPSTRGNAVVGDDTPPKPKSIKNASGGGGVTLLADEVEGGRSFKTKSTRPNKPAVIPADRRRSDSTSSLDGRVPMRGLAVDDIEFPSAPAGSYDMHGHPPRTAATPTDIYNQMLELRRLAENTYQTTRQNHLFMEQSAFSQLRAPPATMPARTPARHLY